MSVLYLHMYVYVLAPQNKPPMIPTPRENFIVSRGAFLLIMQMIWTTCENWWLAGWLGKHLIKIKRMLLHLIIRINCTSKAIGQARDRDRERKSERRKKTSYLQCGNKCNFECSHILWQLNIYILAYHFETHVRYFLFCFTNSHVCAYIDVCQMCAQRIKFGFSSTKFFFVLLAFLHQFYNHHESNWSSNVIYLVGFVCLSVRLCGWFNLCVSSSLFLFTRH